MRDTRESPFQKLIDRKFGSKVFSEDELQAYVDSLVEMRLEYQQTIPAPPENKEQMYAQACAGDNITMSTWRDMWLSHIKQNTQTYDIKKNSAAKEWKKAQYQPVIVAGSGPSLKKNAHELKNRGKIKLVSCLHNFAYFEDNGTPADYYINLDAGDITISELSQGGVKEDKYYWEKTKDRTLVTALVGNPELLKRWKGKILFFNTIFPDASIMEESVKLCDFPLYFNMGGNALGACMYFAKAILGCNPVIYVGADFSFSYDRKFHPFDSPYDQQFSGVMPCTDVFGNRVYTWQSYWNFAKWFAFMACGGQGNNPGLWINATEGGILGAYQEGNISQIMQMSLRQAISQYHITDNLKKILDPKCRDKLLI